MRYEFGFAVILILGFVTLATLIAAADSSEPGRLQDLSTAERESLAQIHSLGVIVRDSGFK